MTMGHYAAALLPWARHRGWPLWLLLVCGQFGDLAWLALAVAGVEPTEPADFMDMSILNMRVSMLWSHGLISVLFQALVVGGLVFAVWKDRALAAWCGGLVLLHLACDALCGWKHEVWGAGSPTIGLGLYERGPTIYLALFLEAGFAALCVAWFIKQRAAIGQAISTRAKVILYAVFAGGGLMVIGNAEVSMREAMAKFQ